MHAFKINGGKRLRGRVRINGAKNACLPLMAAVLLTDEPVILRDVPKLVDINNMFNLLTALGVKSEPNEKALPAGVKGEDQFEPTPGYRMQVTDPEPTMAHYDLVRKMRASICTLGPMLAKRGEAKISMPGGCSIGERPVDLHLRGLKALGAQITLDAGYIVAKAPPGGRLRGTRLFLGGPFGSTVLGTANVMSAATLAEGITIIESAACEPEVEDLANMLNAMGAKIKGAGSPRVIIEGVEKLSGVDYTVMADRIEAGTYIIAAAITNGSIILENCPTDALIAVLDRLQEVGIDVEPLNGVSHTSTTSLSGEAVIPQAGVGMQRQTVRVSSSRRLSPVELTTQPFPGFPTDLQAQMMALLCLSDGNSVITEKIYPDRFGHVPELMRMGATIIRTGSSAVIQGVKNLEGAPVMASDLRASAGLVLAGLAAKGTTTVNRVYHLDRGYEKMELSLQRLGADIERIDVKDSGND
jgi:UDP-N-acetylglucosamine 1-carboxyvinyltransferase